MAKPNCWHFIFNFGTSYCNITLVIVHYLYTVYQFTGSRTDLVVRRLIQQIRHYFLQQHNKMRYHGSYFTSVNVIHLLTRSIYTAIIHLTDSEHLVFSYHHHHHHHSRLGPLRHPRRTSTSTTSLQIGRWKTVVRTNSDPATRFFPRAIRKTSKNHNHIIIHVFI